MSDHSAAENEASGSTPCSPVSTSISDALVSQQGHARLENDLIPSPPTSECGHARPNDSSTVVPSFTNVDGSARVFRFPNELPPAFGTSSAHTEPNERVVTVRDLRSKSCWICSDEDEDTIGSPTQSSSATSSPTTPVRPKRFVHPCNCTLVAHESCLLRWIEQSKRDHPFQEHVTCPQCKAPFILINNKSILLRAFEFFDTLLTRVEPIGAVAIVGGSVLVACTTYGCVAIRMFLGKDAARRALASPWPWHYWLDIPLIPFALIASGLNVFESAMTWLPTLVAFPITSIPIATATAAHGRLLDRYLASTVFTARAYPPGPALTALLVPWIRVFYLALRRKVYRTVLSPFYGSKSDANAASANGRARRNRRRVIIVGEPESYLVNADTAAEAHPMGHGFEATLQMRAAQQDAGDEDDDRPTQTVYVSRHSFLRLCLGALSLPFVANLMGRLLARLARHSPLLARFLGIKRAQPSSSILSSFYTTNSTPTPTSAQSSSTSPIASLFRGQLPFFDGQHSDAHPKATVDAGKPFAERLTLLGYSPRYDDLDPVWFRNAVGAGLWVLLKDAGDLLYRYMRLTQRERISIKDLPFQAGLVSGLDLRD